MSNYEYSQEELRAICEKFIIYGDFLVAVPFGTGHVNDTFQVTFDQGGIRLHYSLQRINRYVFKEPVKVMENMDRVTRHVLSKIHKNHVETKKRTLRLLRTCNNLPYVCDSRGEYWRSYVFVENARAYEMLSSPEQAFCAAHAFGEFQSELVDLPGPRLHETIPDFHNTVKRLEALKAAIKEDAVGRRHEVHREIDFVMRREVDCGKLLELTRQGVFPERITHNDTKASNVLIDDLSGDGICILDLDTVMPGLSLYDFGDLVRAGSSSAEEDELNLDKVGMRFDMYEAICKGFLSSAGSFLTDAEKENLPFAGKLITLETGIRFLTDYLQGDKYFKIRRPQHNLERCRNQLKMVQSIEDQMEAMRKVC